MQNYYAGKLNAAKLFQVYDTGIDRVRQYLEAEIEFVRKDLQGHERILELGAGYGRIMKELAPYAASIVGIDISEDSIAFGKDYLKDSPNCSLLVMDAHSLDYQNEFDIVLCLQNGLSAMKGDPLNLVRRAMAALVLGGRAYFSSYSPRFWEVRLAWFQEQASKGLLGEIDRERTKDGKIVCKDGFTATTFSADDLAELGKKVGCAARIEEVDESSVFAVFEKGAQG
jgi:2-polyprenyl-6-hydroxyphenyl methylase/3-demethylubiquinone-9 3-methyltransferase